MKIFRYIFFNLLFLLPLISFAQTADFNYTSQSNLNCTPHRIIVTQECTGNPQVYIWDFGNGQRGFNAQEIVYYDTAGTYTITLTAVYATTAVTVSKTITINQTPVVNLTADKSLLCTPGLVSFTAEGSSNITTYEWDFGDETIENEGSRVIQHAYTNYGTYNANVKVKTAAGCTAQSNYVININKFGITASVMPNNGCIPATATMGVSTVLPPDENPVNYTWNFGDGSAIVNGSDSIINHIYNITDSITTAKVTVNTSGGCSNELIFAPFAYGTPPVNMRAKTSLQLDSFCASAIIKFVGEATGANLYTWKFGDSLETSSSDTSVTHKYRMLGNRTAIATASLNGCDGAQDSVAVFVKGVVAEFTYGNQCNMKNDYWFANASLGNITKYTWFFSDNATTDSTHFNAAHLFPVQGSFKASLSLYDNTTGCTDETVYNIYTAIPILNRDLSKVCKDSLINYTVSSSYPDSAGFTYKYYVCGDSVINTSASLDYNPSKHGSYVDYVVIEDQVPGTCSDTLRFTDNTIVRGPLTEIATQERNCMGKAFTFTNTSYPFFATDAINNWQWDFGDSTYSNAKDAPPHLYIAPGLFTVKLTATDINGCRSISQTDVLSHPLPQIVAFPARDTICSGDTVMLRAYSVENLVWMPATNISCINCDTAFAYPTTTTTYIAQATTYFNCKSYDTVEIKVIAPVHVKISPADTSICPGQSVNYTVAAGDGIVSWQPAAWLNQTTINNAVATPLQDTSYTVMARDAAGCYTDTATAVVHVYGLPTVDAGTDKMLPYNAAFTLTPVYSPGIVSYNWSPATGLDCNNCPTPSGAAGLPASYTVTVTSSDGCTAKDNINIFIECSNANLQLPTAFSPNGNGMNDYFYPIARGYKTIKRFVIFNRLGNKVFEKQNFPPNNPASGWDGIIRGAETTSSTETFVWFIEAECQQGELIQNKGTVTLVR